MKNEKVFGKVFYVKEEDIEISGAVKKTLPCKFGWNEFEIQLDKPGISKIKTKTSKKTIEIFDCEEEKNPVKVGYDLTQIVHDDTGELYSGQWNCKNRDKIKTPVLSAMPSIDANEDGEARIAKINIADAEVIAWDKATGEPLLVRKKYGEGYVYTITAWVYPGHEKFQEFSASWIAQLSKEALTKIYVEDNTNEVFWTIWEDGDKTTVMMLNTDWTIDKNEKTVNLVVGDKKTEVTVRERDLLMAEVKNDKVCVKKFSL